MIKQAIAWAMIQIILRLIQWIPIRGLHRMGALLGRFAYRLPSRKHATILANLERAYPDLTGTQRACLHRQAVIEVTRFGLESGLVWHASRHRIDQLITRVDGWHLIESAQMQGRGVLLIGAHLGNWEILNLYCMHRLQLKGLYRSPKDPIIDRWVRAARERMGGELIPSGSLGMRKLLRTLKQGGVAGIIADQQPKLGDGVIAPFFGHPALTMTLIGRLAAQTGCQLLMATAYREVNEGFAVVIEEPPETIHSDDPIQSATALNQAFENAIQRHPAQYLWRYQRFS